MQRPSALPSPTSIDKALDVLFHLHAAGRPQGVTAIGRALGVPKSSAHRLLAALGRRGVVERDDRGRYRPGVALVALGLGALAREPLATVARPVLEAEAESLGETVFLVASRGGRLLVLEKAEGTGFLRAAPRVGSEVPVHATAVGKLFLAFDPGSIAPGGAHLERFTPRTIVEREALRAEVAAVRARGFATSCEEWIAGLSVVAAPVLAGGRMPGAVAVAAPSARLDALGLDVVTRRALAAADRIGQDLEPRIREGGLAARATPTRGEGRR